MKNVKPKSYFVLGLIIVATIIVSFYLFSWYKHYNDNKLSNSVISDTLMEVKYDDLDSVLRERDFLIVYMCTTSEKMCRSFEAKFKDYIANNNLNDDIVYLSLGFKNDENDYSVKIYDRYKGINLVKKINKYPTLLVFKSGEIIDILSSSDKVLSLSQIDDFLKGYEL